MNRAQRRLEKKQGRKNNTSVTTQGSQAIQKLKHCQMLLQNGRLEEAQALCDSVLVTLPQSVDALNMRGVIAKKQGKLEEAIAYYRKTLEIDPHYLRGLYNLANVMLQQGYTNEAIPLMRQVLAIQPNHPGALHHVAKHTLEAGEMQETFSIVRRLIQANPGHPEYWNWLMQSMVGLPDSVLDAPFKADIMMLTDTRLVPQQQLTHTIYETLKRTNQAFADCMKTAPGSRWPMEHMLEVMEDKLARLLFRRFIMGNNHMEIALSGFRATLLDAYPFDSEIYDDVLLTLAWQCHINEYVWYSSPEEDAAIATLLKEVEGRELTSSAEDMRALLMLGCYMPLNKLVQAEQLLSLAGKWQHKNIEQFIQMSVGDILEERAIAQEIESLGTIDHTVSRVVQEQYEENPYPRWNQTGATGVGTPVMLVRQEWPWCDVSRLNVKDAPEILIAGCGTGMHAITTAQRFREAKVTAVDLSRASLAYATRKTREYGLENSISFLHADILNLARLNKSFDVVESAGVLHHMEDPMAGWRVITDFLRPGGLMKIGLYSAAARKEITEERARIAEQGIRDDADSIRAFRQKLLSMPDLTQVKPYATLRDFYSLSEFRDLLFHRQEHVFTIPQIEQALKTLGLEFIGFEIADPQRKKLYGERFPDDERQDNLANWHILEGEQPRLFIGMYQFWVFKK